MLDRRTLLSTAAGAGMAAAAPGVMAQPAQAVGPVPAAAGEAGRLNALLDAFFQADLRRSPETATTLGFDHGAGAGLKSRLDARSPQARAEDKARTADQLRRLGAINRGALSGLDRVNYDVVLYGLTQDDRHNRAFAYGPSPAGQPYALTQLGGAYLEIPDFLDTRHAIADPADAEAYLARVEAFARVMDGEADQVRHDAALGVVSPAFVIATTLGQMKQLADTPADQSTIVTSLVRRTAAKGLAGDWGGRASALYTGAVVPAVRRQMALLESLRPQATPGPGVFHLPDGKAYYAASLNSGTTTALSPAEVHRMGLEQVAALTVELDRRFREQGMSQGAVWERLRALFHDPRFLYPNTDAGKARLIADLNTKVQAIQARLPQYFGTLPKAGVVIRRVPPAIEAGASSNYQSGALDGSRPGAYYIVLRDTAEDPSWLMSTLTYHEAIPGHHLQITLANEAALPLIRKAAGFNAYQEGWALYAEQLADEMGLYEHDPFGRIGYLHDALLRAARLVMDTGLHAMGWSREQAVRYFVENQGDPESSAVAEVERYCVWPGQACGYMVGKLDWLRLRDQARTRLGTRFDIRRFHDAGLLSGPMPLAVLDGVIADYVARAA